MPVVSVTRLSMPSPDTSTPDNINLYPSSRLASLIIVVVAVTSPVHWAGGAGVWRDAGAWEGGAVTTAEQVQISASGSFVSHRTGRAGTQLEHPPFKGPVGAWIQANISSETWNDWIGQGPKVINELRLDFSREEDQESYDRHMREFLGIDDDLLNELRSTA